MKTFGSLTSIWMLLLITLPSSGQTAPTSLAGTVTDPGGMPLAYASIGVVNTPVGTVADSDGRFNLYVTSNIQPTDTLRISLLGYAPISLPVRTVQVNLVAKPFIELAPVAMQLTEVTVRSGEWKVRETGNDHVSAKMKTNFALFGKPRQNLGAEIGRVFRVPKKGAYLEQFRFYVSANNFDSTQFRINVYTLRRNYPTSSLLQRPVYISLKKAQTGWVTVDLRPYNLFAADDIAVGIEWVDYGGEGNYLGIPITMPSMGAVHLYKYGSQSRWKKFGQMSACMNLTMVTAP